jgi:KTSC domain-containing protein
LAGLRAFRLLDTTEVPRTPDEIAAAPNASPYADQRQVYRYAQVALQAFNKFLDAESAGKHYNSYFKPFLRAGGLTAHVATPELRRAAAPGSG